MTKRYAVLGLMSGSSLDGLDVALCHFEVGQRAGAFHLKNWQMEQAATLPFTVAWQEKLKKMPTAGGLELALAHTGFGHYLGELVNRFFRKNKLEPSMVDLIASHGHTIFHEPDQGLTLQIGDGAALAAATGCKVAAEFRTADVAHGGQGAPLAPMADKLLFPGFDFYLNLGGIANIACHLPGGHFVAFDVTGANQVLNAITLQHAGAPYDKDGIRASQGSLDLVFLENLNAQGYFAQPYPKSLSNQWVQANLVAPYLDAPLPAPNKLHTACRHVAQQLAASIAQIVEKEGFNKEKYQMLATGGGVFNRFLMACIREECPSVEVVVPAQKLVKFKEAALMALLGALRLEEAPNSLSSVTGARKNACGGAVFLP